jgi:hypothetical protein
MFLGLVEWILPSKCEGPEFKPQYLKRKRKKKERKELL